MSSRSPSARPASWPSRARGGGCPGSAPCSPWPASPPSSMARSPWPREDPELCQYPAVPWPSPVDVRSEISDLPVERVLDLLSGLPPSDGYEVHVKPLRWRTRPHLAALTNFDDKLIQLQVPV